MKILPHCSQEGNDENEEQTTVEAGAKGTSCKSLEGSPPANQNGKQCGGPSSNCRTADCGNELSEQYRW